MQVHMLTEGGIDAWSLSPSLHVILRHICLAVCLEPVWGCIDECVPVCLCIYEPRAHELG